MVTAQALHNFNDQRFFVEDINHRERSEPGAIGQPVRDKVHIPRHARSGLLYLGMTEQRGRDLDTRLSGMKSCGYVYDFGDNWEKKIKVEKILPPDACSVPMCIGATNAWSRSDIGGPFDPTKIDRDAIDDRLQHINP